MRSRIQKRLKKNSVKSIIFLGIGAVVLIIVMIQYGIPVLVNASYFLTGHAKDETEIKKKEGAVYIEQPILDEDFSATNSAAITINGSSKKDLTIQLYVNKELVDTTPTNSRGKFTFESVSLEEGRNSIKVRATDDNKDSEYSRELIISYIKKAPEVSIESPTDNQSYSKDEKTAQVKGKTDPEVKVTVNDAWAIIDGAGNFSYNLPLHDGENVIKIVATDPAGNKTEVEKKVTYSP